MYRTHTCGGTSDLPT